MQNISCQDLAWREPRSEVLEAGQDFPAALHLILGLLGSSCLAQNCLFTVFAKCLWRGCPDADRWAEESLLCSEGWRLSPCPGIVKAQAASYRSYWFSTRGRFSPSHPALLSDCSEHMFVCCLHLPCWPPSLLTDLYFYYSLICHLSNQTTAYPDVLTLLYANLAQVPGASMFRP